MPIATRMILEQHAFAATTETHGIVTFVAENGELAVEETVEIFYMPPVGMFKNPDALLYCGGFNGWDGEEDPMTIPMMPTDDGRFRVSLSVPNFAKVGMLRMKRILSTRVQLYWEYDHAKSSQTCRQSWGLLCERMDQKYDDYGIQY